MDVKRLFGKVVELAKEVATGRRSSLPPKTASSPPSSEASAPRTPDVPRAPRTPAEASPIAEETRQTGAAEAGPHDATQSGESARSAEPKKPRVAARARTKSPGASSSSYPPAATEDDERASDPPWASPPLSTSPSSPPGHGDTTKPSDEPIRTRTMARLLAAQGHIARARALYDLLLSQTPDDHELTLERNALDDIRPPTARPSSYPPPPDAPVDVITASIGAGTSLVVTWDVTADGLARARAVLADEAQAALTVRVLTISADERHVVRSKVFAEREADARGTWTVTDLPARATCFAAVGLRAADRFVAIAHAPSVQTSTPSSAPSEIVNQYVHFVQIVQHGLGAQPLRTTAPTDATAAFAVSPPPGPRIMSAASREQAERAAKMLTRAPWAGSSS